MATVPTPPLPAHALLDILDRTTVQPLPSDAQAERAVEDFLQHLRAVDAAQKPKQWSERYLVDQVFGRMRRFNSDVERRLYCRCHLRVAIEQFTLFIQELKTANGGLLTYALLKEWRDNVIDYIYDLATIVPFLQRHVPGYVFLRGGKNATVHSWEVYLLAKGLAYQSTHWGKGPALDHKTAQIAAIGVLRQALELRFDRIIAVYPTDKKGKAPKLRHGFHQGFIVAHPQYFKAQGFSIVDLKPMYDWCSEVVHQAYQPFAWQTSWALRLAGRLLNSQPVAHGSAWSIANAVHIVDVQAMQAAYEEHFLASYDHGVWQMTRERPEALVSNWTPNLAFTSPDFRPARDSTP